MITLLSFITGSDPSARRPVGAEVRAPAWRLPLSGGKQTFDLNVRFSADYVCFSPRSGRIDTVTVESARDPKETLAPIKARVVEDARAHR